MVRLLIPIFLVPPFPLLPRFLFQVITDSFAGPWCYCKDPAPGTQSPIHSTLDSGPSHSHAHFPCIPLNVAGEPFAGYCTAPELVPEQINLQLAEGNVVVASFVTYEKSRPAAPAVAMFGSDPNNMQSVTGITHTYVLPDTGRTYYLHFVKLSGENRCGPSFTFVWGTVPSAMIIPQTPQPPSSGHLQGMTPRGTYYYKVRSGNPSCEWSKMYNFRAPYSTGETRVAFYGDMGHR